MVSNIRQRIVPTMKALKTLSIVSAVAFSYVLLYELNETLFSALGYSEGVSWIYLPSGLRLVFVLLFVEWGSIGIAMASLFISYWYQFHGDGLTILGAGMISGFAPWLARAICVDAFKLDVDLANLTVPTLMKMAIVFSVLSPVLHQIWYVWRGVTQDFISSVAVMAIGDLVGTMIMLYLAKRILMALPPIGTTERS